MTTKLTLTIIIITLVAIFTGWFLSSLYVSQFQKNQFGAENNAPDTTANISAELNQIPGDDSLQSDMKALDQDLQNF